LAIDVGCRWLDTDCGLGEDATSFGYDVLPQGPVLRFVFRF